MDTVDNGGLGGGSGGPGVGSGLGKEFVSFLRREGTPLQGP